MQKTIPKILISDPTPSSFHSLTVVKKSKTVSHQCKICGDLAKHANYGVMTCDSCKIFFKRNVTRGKVC
jgi:ribosomal protein L37AE/L43A